MMEPRIGGGTVAMSFRKAAKAREAVGRLRAAGFADVRISERVGRTREAHVAPELGLTAADFVHTLERSGFSAADAEAFTNDVSRGALLVTIAANERSNDAIAVLRGAAIAAPVLHPAGAVEAPMSMERPASM